MCQPQRLQEEEDDEYEEEEEDYYKSKPRAAPRGGFGRGDGSIQDVLGLRPGYTIGSIRQPPEDKYLLKREDMRWVAWR